MKLILKDTVWDPVEGEVFEVVNGVSVGISEECRSERGKVGFVSVDGVDELSTSTHEIYAAVLTQTLNLLLGTIVIFIAS